LFEDRVLRKTFGPGKDEAIVGWKNYIIRSFIMCTIHKIGLLLV
jgi:hypothetical protein